MKGKRTTQYFLLTIILVILLITTYLVSARYLKALLVLAIAGVYFVFGIIHHIEEKNLDAKVVWEYLAISVLAFVVLFSLLVGQI